MSKRKSGSSRKGRSTSVRGSAAGRKKESSPRAAAPKSGARKKASATKKHASKRKVAKKAVAKKSATKKRSKLRAAVSTPSRNKRAASRKPSGRRPARLASHRLDDSVLPLAYFLSVNVDPSADTGFSGSVRIEVDLRQPVNRIRLHAADLEIQSARLERPVPSETRTSLRPSGAHPSILEIGPTQPATAPAIPGTLSAAPRRPFGLAERKAGREKHAEAEQELETELPSFLPPAAWPVRKRDESWKRHRLDEASEVIPEETPEETSPRTGPEVGIEHPELWIEEEAGPPTGSFPLALATVPGDGALEATVRLEPETETAWLDFDRGVPAGTATLHLRFRGKLRTDLCGLYFAQSDEHRYAFTQLEASNARRFFPCFDEPRFKAPLVLQVTTDQDNETLSNALVEEVRYDDEGRKTVTFAATEPLPTYLYALAVGPLECSASQAVGRTEVKVWHVPGKESLSAFGLEAAVASLERLEAYFGIPYPFGKLDLVAVPDFEIGAMENAGAVFFRETLLLVDPATSTSDERKRAAEVIAHELAHMWFGDLVTMRWWDDLWLKESFATWMAYVVVDAWKPEWRMWHRFEEDRGHAYDLDSLLATRPVYAPVEDPGQVSEQYDAITYEKGASVVRMIEHYLGPATFQEGVRLYLRRHAGGNASADDLWSALAEASGQDVALVVRPWIENEGYPLLRVERKKGGAYELKQQRFLETAPPASSGRSTRWPLPFVGRWSTATDSGEHRQLLDRVRVDLELPEALRSDPTLALYGNADEGGFYRVAHAKQELDLLLAPPTRLRSVERLGLVSHLWACVRAGHSPLADFLDVVASLGEEEDPDVLHQLAGPLEFLAEVAQAAGPATARAYQDFLVSTFAGALLGLGLEPRPGEAEESRQRRARLHSLLGEVANFGPLVAAARRSAAAYVADPTRLDAELADPVVFLAAAHAGPDQHSALVQAMRNATTPQHRQRFLLALGKVRADAVVARSLDLCLTSAVPTQDVGRLLAQLLRNPAAREATWRFLTRHWSKLSDRLPPALVRRMIEAAQYRATPGFRAEFRRFFRSHEVRSAARTLRQVEERIEIRRAQMRRNRVELMKWLRRRNGN